MVCLATVKSFTMYRQVSIPRFFFIESIENSSSPKRHSHHLCRCGRDDRQFDRDHEPNDFRKTV